MMFQSNDSDLIQIASDDTGLNLKGTMSCDLPVRRAYRGHFLDLSRLMEMAVWCNENANGPWRFLLDAGHIRREGFNNTHIAFGDKNDQIKFQLTFTEDFRELGVS